MTPVIVFSDPGGGPVGGEGTRGLRQSLPAKRRTVAHSRHTERGLCRAIFGASSVVVSVRGATGKAVADAAKSKSARQHCIVASRIQFVRGFKAPRSLSLGNPRFKPRKQSLRDIAEPLHCVSSFVAPAPQVQRDRSDVECPTRALKDRTR